MKIDNLSATAIKGQSFSHQLGALTLITGRNYAGKTARLDAVRVGLTGIVPEIGARTKDTFLLATGTGMSIRLDLGEYHIDRLYRLEKGSVKASTSTSLDDDTIKRIESSPLLNTSEYFAMSDNQRLSYLFANVPLPSDYTVDGIAAKLQRVNLDEHTEASEAAKQAWIEVVRKTLAKNVVNGLNDLLNKENGRLTEEFTVANRRAKDTEGAVRVMTELKLREATWSADTIADLERQIELRNIEYKEQSEKLGTLKEKQETYARTSELRVKLLATTKLPVPDWNAERRLWQEKLDKLSVVRDIPMPNPELVNSLRDKVGSLTHAEKTLLKKVEETRGMAEDIKGKDNCPYCESSQEGWRTRVLERLQKDLTAALVDLDEASHRTGAAKVEYSDAKKAYDDLMVEHQASLAARQPIAQARAELLAVDRKEREFAEARTQAAKVLENLGDPEPADAESVRQQAAHVHSLAMALGELRKRRDDAKRLSQDAARAAQAALEHETAAMQVALIKNIGKELRVVQTLIVDAAFKGLMTVANRVSDGVLKAPLDYHEGDIGMWSGSQWISHKTFSGTEQAVAHIAVATALSATFPLKIVLLDELARVDDVNTKRLMVNLAKCVHDGILEQVIAIDVRPHTSEDGWQIIAL